MISRFMFVLSIFSLFISQASFSYDHSSAAVYGLRYMEGSKFEQAVKEVTALQGATVQALSAALRGTDRALRFGALKYLNEVQDLNPKLVRDLEYVLSRQDLSNTGIMFATVALVSGASRSDDQTKKRVFDMLYKRIDLAELRRTQPRSYYAFEQMFRFGQTAAPAVPLLVQVLNWDKEGFVRLSMKALSAIGDKARPALPKLREIASSGEQQELGKSARDAIAVIDSGKS